MTHSHRTPSPVRLALFMMLGATGLATTAIVPLAVPAKAQQQQRAGAQEDLQRVQRHIRAITTLSAGFTQTSPNGQVQTGKLLWKQPGHIRFDYGRGVPMLIVADGRSLYLVDYEVSQVQRWPIRNSPLGALLDPKRDLIRYGTVIPTGDPRVLSVNVRDPERPEFGVINLVFKRDPAAPAGIELYGWVAKDAQGNRTNIRLTDHRYGAAIADSAFKWRDPRPNQRGPQR